jgi:hypothetical protein
MLLEKVLVTYTPLDTIGLKSKKVMGKLSARVALMGMVL